MLITIDKIDGVCHDELDCNQDKTIKIPEV